MSERDAWREAMRRRMRGSANAAHQAAEIDAEAAAALAASSARVAPEYKSYASPDNWQQRGAKGTQASSASRSGLSKEEWKRRQAEGVRRRHSEQRAAIAAAGARACVDCKRTMPLDRFRPRSTDADAPTWYPYCRDCESLRANERRKRQGSKATMTPEQRLAARVAGTKANAERKHAELVAAGEKACSRCKAVKPLSEFSEHKLPSGRVGWHAYCRPCHLADGRERYRRKYGGEEHTAKRKQRERVEQIAERGVKACGRCGQTLPLDAFGTRKQCNGVIGWQAYCRPCQRAASREQAQRKRGEQEAAA